MYMYMHTCKTTKYSAFFKKIREPFLFHNLQTVEDEEDDVFEVDVEEFEVCTSLPTCKCR